MIESVYIELTNVCNLRCKHCYNSSCGQNEKKYLSIETIRKLLSLQEKNEGICLQLSGGEIALYPDLERLISEFAEYGWRVSVVTNGLLLTQNLMKCFEKYGVKVQVSIEGPRAVNDFIRGDEAYARVTGKITELLKILDSDHLAVKAVLTNLLMGKVREFVEEIISLGVVHIEFGKLSFSGRAKGSFYNLYVPDNYQVVKLNQEILEIMTVYPDIVKPFMFCYSCGLLYSAEHRHNIRIDVNGNVYLCQGFSSENMAIGNLNEGTLPEMLDGEKARNLITMLRERQQLYPCNNCILQKANKCLKGCPAEELNRNGENIGQDGDCYARRYQYISKLVQSGRAI